MGVFRQQAGAGAWGDHTLTPPQPHHRTIGLKHAVFTRPELMVTFQFNPSCKLGLTVMMVTRGAHVWIQGLTPSWFLIDTASATVSGFLLKII